MNDQKIPQLEILEEKDRCLMLSTGHTLTNDQLMEFILKAQIQNDAAAKKRFSFQKAAEAFAALTGVRYVYYGDRHGEFYRWTGNCWERYDEPKLKNDLKQIFGAEQFADIFIKSSYFYTEFLETLKTVNPFKSPGGKKPGIYCQNKVIRLADNSVKSFDHDPENFNTSCLDITFDEDKGCPEFKAFIESVFPEPEGRAVIQELFGYILSSDNHQIIPFLTGPSGTSKSTVVRLLSVLMGETNVSNASIESLSKTHGLQGLLNSRGMYYAKRLNVSEEQGLDYIDASMVETMKSLSSGNSLLVNIKGLPQINVRFNTVLLLIANRLPSIQDATDGIFTRLMPIPMNTKIGEQAINMDQLIDRLLLKEGNGILWWAIRGYLRIKKAGLRTARFTEWPASLALLEQAKLDSSPIMSWKDQNLQITGNKDDQIIKTEVYNDYKLWCQQNGHNKPASAGTVGRSLMYDNRVDESRPRTPEGVRREVYTGLKFMRN